MTRLLIDASKFDDAYRSYNDTVIEALETIAGVMDPFATMVTEEAPEVEYDWIGDLPEMREWIGERVVQLMRAEKHIIRNKDWEVTVGVARDDIRFDRFAKVRPKLMMLGGAVARKREELLTSLFLFGFDDSHGVAYDGQYFFDSDHTTAGNGEGQGYSNVTNALFDEDSYDAGYQSMISRVNDHGIPLGVQPTHLVYGPALRAAVKRIILQQRDDAGADNTRYQEVVPVLNPRLIGAHAKKWGLFDLSKPIKPFIFQTVPGVNFVAKDRPDDHGMFWEKQAVFGLDGTFNAGFGLPQLAYASDGSGS